MGLLDKLKKGRTRRGQKEKQHQKQPFQQNLSQKTDPWQYAPAARHGAAFYEREKRDALKGDVCGDIVEASWKNGAAWRLRIACMFYCS